MSLLVADHLDAVLEGPKRAIGLAHLLRCIRPDMARFRQGGQGVKGAWGT